jgi:hypothetical protein
LQFVKKINIAEMIIRDVPIFCATIVYRLNKKGPNFIFSYVINPSNGNVSTNLHGKISTDIKKCHKYHGNFLKCGAYQTPKMALNLCQIISVAYVYSFRYKILVPIG